MSLFMSGRYKQCHDKPRLVLPPPPTTPPPAMGDETLNPELEEWIAALQKLAIDVQRTAAQIRALSDHRDMDPPRCRADAVCPGHWRYDCCTAAAKKGSSC